MPLSVILIFSFSNLPTARLNELLLMLNSFLWQTRRFYHYTVRNLDFRLILSESGIFRYFFIGFFIGTQDQLAVISNFRYPGMNFLRNGCQNWHLWSVSIHDSGYQSPQRRQFRDWFDTRTLRSNHRPCRAHQLSAADRSSSLHISARFYRYTDWPGNPGLFGPLPFAHYMVATDLFQPPIQKGTDLGNIRNL